MELSTLKFVVDTKELETAATRIEELGTAVNKLNKPMQNLTRESAKTNKELSKAEEAAAKAALAQHKLEQAQSKSNEATGKSISLLERHNLILQFQAEGNSKGQASILATAKAAGMLDHELLELNKTLVLQRTLMGTEPFDNSIGLHQKLQNQTKITEEVTELFNRSLGLTEKQMVDLAREKQRLIALYGIEGKSLDGLAAEYEQIVQMSRQINQANDARTNSMKAQIKAENDSARANEYLAKEMERVNRLNSEGADITSATNNRLIRFERELKASGASAAEAATKLDAYRNALLSAQKVAGNRQVDYLSRALGPQITDIAVGLATGQAPLTILLQQGGQLRDQFALAGVAGADMGKMLVQATSSMITSIKDVGVAIGSALIGAITKSGAAVTKFAMDVTGSTNALEKMRYQIALIEQGSGGPLMKTFIALGKVLTFLTGTILASAIVSLGLLVKGFFDAVKEQDALAIQLTLTGASLGLNTQSAIAYAKSLNEVGISTGSAIKVIQAMAKEGGFVASEINMVATSANNLKLAGVAIEDVVKQFSKLKEKPVEALIEIAKNTGLIKPEIIALVSELEQQGKTSDAAAIAMKAYADVTIQQKDRLKSEMSEFSLFMKSLSSSVGKFYDEVFVGLFRKTSPTEALKREIASLENTIKVGTQASPETKAANNATLANLKEQLRLSQMAADAQSTADNDNIRAAKALGEWQKLSVTNLDKEKKAELDIANIRKVGLEAKKSEAEIEKLVASYREKNKSSAAPRTGAQNDFANILETANKFYQTQIGAVDNLTKSEIALNKVREDDRYKAFTAEQKKQIDNIYEQAKANEILVKSEKEAKEELERQQKINAEIVKTRNELVEAGAKQVDAAKLTTQALADESALYDYKLTLVGKEEKEVEKLLAQKKIQIEYEKEIARIKSLNLLSGAKEDLQLEAYRQFTLKRENLDKDANLKAATDFQKQFDNLKTGIADSIVTALIEGGETGGKKLRALIEAELRKPVVMIVKAVVDASMGGLTGSSGAGSSIASSLIGNTVGKLAIGGSTLGAMGQYFATGFMNTVAGTGAAGGAAAGSAIGGANGMAMQMGAYGPYALAAVAVLNALGAFRTTKQVGGGISGTLGGSVNQFATMRKSGTLFSGPKYFRENQGTFAGNEALQQSFNNLKASTTTMADVLGISSDSVKTFTKTIDISFDGLTNTQIEEKIASTLRGVNDELAALVLGAGATADQLSSLYNTVMQQRYDLETQLLELQGDTLALRERERAKIYETNKGLFDQIKALEDKKAADEKAAEAMQKLTDVTTSIVDEINRLRGVNTSQSGLESQFAILTAQARSGDLNALAQLPEVTKGLEQIAASTAVNATDIIFARARLAQSLQDTLGYTDGFTASATTSMASIGSVSASGTSVSSNVTSASSNQELLAALVVEVQGLRAEVRADVSHNAKTAKILERVNQDGESLTITTLV